MNIYNQILETVLPVERPLVQFKLDNIDKVLLKGIKHLVSSATQSPLVTLASVLHDCLTFRIVSPELEVSQHLRVYSTIQITSPRAG